ncbi:hypothetical protein GCM10027053_33410 [Intrasporangium mesophilum]
MRRERVMWAVTAVVSALLFVAIGWWCGRTDSGRQVDDTLTNVVLTIFPDFLRRALDQFARPLVIVILAPIALVLALLGVARRAWVRVLTATFIAVLAPFLSLQLSVQALLHLPDDAYPSDHATVAFALLVSVVVLWPAPVGQRGLVVASAVALATGIGNVSWYAHHVSDVLGSALLVTVVSALALTVAGHAATNVRLSDRD